MLIFGLKWGWVEHHRLRRLFFCFCVLSYLEQIYPFNTASSSQQPLPHCTLLLVYVNKKMEKEQVNYCDEMNLINCSSINRIVIRVILLITVLIFLSHRTHMQCI